MSHTPTPALARGRKQKGLRATGLIFCLLLGTIARPTAAQAAPPAQASDPPPLVSNVWVDVPLSQVLRDVSTETGVTIALDPSVADQPVSLQVKDAPLEECLQKLTAAQGLAVRRMPEGFYVIGTGKPDSPSFDRLAEYRRVPLKYITERHLKSSLPAALLPYVASGERKTEVLVVGPQEKIKHVMEIVGLLDVPPQQVVLEALVVELSQEASRQLGIDWEWAGGHTLLSIDESAGAFTGVIRQTSIAEREFSSLLLTLRMLVRNGQAGIRSRPRVATLNGEQASIEVTLEEYFSIITDIGAFVRSELQVVKSGVILQMTPQIGDKGDITITVSTEVSDVATRQGGVSTGTSKGDTLPVVRRRKATTRVRVKEGDAIVIGGLIESQQHDEVKRVPVLGSIPLLGALFRSTNVSTVEKEVVIFITPRIMAPGQSPFSDRHTFISTDEELAKLREGATMPAPATKHAGVLEN